MIVKAGVFLDKTKRNLSDWTVTLLANNDIHFAFAFPGIISLGSMKQHDRVGVLFQAS